MGRRSLLGSVRETGRLPWAALSRTGRLSIAGVAVAAMVAVALGVTLPRIAENQSIGARAEAAHRLVHSLLSTHLIPTIDGPLSGDEYRAFDEMVRDGLLGGENVRVKLWNPSGQVIYSDEPIEIGRRYAIGDDPDLQKALSGTTAAHISDMSREEHEFDTSLGAPLLEIYVPVHEGPLILGAFEIYQQVGPLEAHLGRIRTAVWIAVGTGLAILLVFLILLFAATGRSMAREHRAAVQRADDLGLLLRIARRLSREVSIEAAGRDVLEAVSSHLGMRCAALWVGEAAPVLAFSSHGEGLCPTVVSAARSSLAEHQPPVSGSVEASVVAAEDCQVVVVPFPVGTDATGVLAGCADRALGERECLVVMGVAHQLSVAIESARRYDGLREMTEERGRLLRRQVEAQEEERRHLVGDLHDGLGQVLTRILFGLRGSRARLAGQPEVAEELGRLEDLAEDQSRSIRRFMARIRPAVLEDFGLPAALEALAREHEAEWPVPIEVTVEAMPDLDPAVGVTIYRAAQEAVMNARKYAKPSRVSVRLSRTDGHVVLTVHDDGTGSEDLREGTGLSHLRDRVTSLGGTVEVRSSREAGTTLTATLPIEAGGDGADPRRR